MPVFTLSHPDSDLPLVLDSPHSGTDYPDDFEYACDFLTLRQAEDSHVDALFSGAPDHGASLLSATFPRSYIDVNRAVDDIDPAIVQGIWPYGATNPTIRSDSGIGLIRRLVTPGEALYAAPLSAEAIKHRIDTYYFPYHAALKDLLDTAHYHFGHVYHLNCHSMPASTAYPKRARTIIGNILQPSDIVLSNRDGSTSGTEFIHMLRDLFRGFGYRVTLNDPFKGVELVRRYALPTRGRHSVQIEINKALYMNEDTCEPHEGFEPLKDNLDQVIAQVAEYVRAQKTQVAAD